MIYEFDNNGNPNVSINPPNTLPVNPEALKEAVKSAKSSSYQEALEDIKPLVEEGFIRRCNEKYGQTPTETDMPKNVVKQKVAPEETETLIERDIDEVIERDIDKVIEELEEESGIKSPPIDANQKIEEILKASNLTEK